MLIDDVLENKGRMTVSIAPNASLAEASKLMTKRRLGCLVVTDAAGGLAGILTERDLVRTLADGGRGSLRMSVGHVMTLHVHTCSLTDSVEKAMATMARYHIRHLPVVEGYRVVGVVSVRDLTQVLLSEQAQHAESLVTLGRCRPAAVARAL